MFWTVNTEHYNDIIPSVNNTADNLLTSIFSSHSEVSPSTLFATTAILKGEPFVNSASQNIFVPGVIKLVEHNRSFIGQTKLKSVLAEFLMNTNIKPLSIASYNHLGKNDGHNLSVEHQLKSKEISKSSVIDDMVNMNWLLYKAPISGAKDKSEHPDHIIVIKYIPTGSNPRGLLMSTSLRFFAVAGFEVQEYLKVKGWRNKSSGGNTHLVKVNDGYYQEWGPERSQIDRTNQKITCWINRKGRKATWIV